MTTPQTITSEIQKLEPSAVIELFRLDLTFINAGLFYFHAGTNGLTENIVFNGITYYRFPIQATGFDFSGRGQLPRPKLVVANVTGAITGLVLLFQDLVGARLVRRRTMVKYLDAVNFDGGVNATADPNAIFPDDVYYIDRKSGENRDIVEFELAAAFDLYGVQIPRRQIIQNLCVWKYRSADCGYTGTSYFDENDQPVGSAAQDVCGKRLSSCKKRFTVYQNIDTSSTTNTLAPDGQLTSGQSLTSPNGWYRAVMQTDGNFVVYTKAGNAIWNSQTQGNTNAFLWNQGDGNLVIYNSAGTVPLWNTETGGSGFSNSLVLQNDGNLVLYTSGGVAVWSIGYSSSAEPYVDGSPELPFGSFPAAGLLK